MRFLLLVALIPAIFCREYEDIWHYGTFPEDFMWSTATSDYQIEGAWDQDGKGLGIWDTFVRQSGTIEDGSDGDEACLSYYKYKEDVALMKDMGVTHYRFGISWPRILPEGRGWIRNQAGVDYYKNVIAELKAAGIEPVVTLFHWNTPQALEDDGGFLNEGIIEAFYNYSRICFEEFGADVKHWVTFNEPWIITYLAYGIGSKAPGMTEPAEAPYQSAHNLLLAHAKVYHLYDQEFRPTQGGEIGITLNGGWSEPKEPDNQAHIEACERNLQFNFGWFAEPIWGPEGNYPKVMRDMIADKSMRQGYNRSRLPEFTAEQIEELKGTSDFFGLNYYGAGWTFDLVHDLNPARYDKDADVGGDIDPDWLGSGSSWLWVTPWSIRKMLNWISDTYDNPRILITENGVSDRNGSLADAHRVFYYRGYINNVLKAIDLDGNRVIGYTAWSLLDNFEWEMGYIERFGLHYVNFTDPEKPRVAKDSARFYAQVIKDNGFLDSAADLSPSKLALFLPVLLVALFSR